jgi:hypothetical protein
MMQLKSYEEDEEEEEDDGNKNIKSNDQVISELIQQQESQCQKIRNKVFFTCCVSTW